MKNFTEKPDIIYGSRHLLLAIFVLHLVRYIKGKGHGTAINTRNTFDCKVGDI